MENSSTSESPPSPRAPGTPDGIRLRRWWALYTVLLVLAGVPLAILVAREPWQWAQWKSQFHATFAATHPAVKLLTMGIYLSLCTTVLPLPTGWLIACVATRQAAVAGSAGGTVLAVALVGAFASTVANLNEYHLITWVLRHPWFAAARWRGLSADACGGGATRPSLLLTAARAYRWGGRWFDRGPFLLVLIFNIVPFPVDVVRILAAARRYPRGPFAAANFLGRIVRYAVIAFVTYWWNLGWIAVVALLGLAAAMGLARVGVWLARRIVRGRVQPPAAPGV